MSLIGNTVDRFANQAVQLVRYDGFYDAGRWESRQTETLEFKANVQPATGADLERLPENYRQQAAFWVYPRTSLELRTGAASGDPQTPGVVADRVILNGVEFEVATAEVWRQHRRYLVVRATQ